MTWWLIVMIAIGAPANVGTQVSLTQPTISITAYTGPNAEGACKAVRDQILKSPPMGQLVGCTPQPQAIPVAAP